VRHQTQGTVAFSPDSRRLAISGPDGSIELCDVPSGKRLGLLGPGPLPYSLVYHPREAKLAIVQNSGVVIRDLETGKVLQQFSHPHEPWPFAAWHPDGKILGAVGGDQIIRFWDVASGKEVSKLEGFKNGGNSFAFHADGDLLATNGWEGR